jgi:rod shape-determining protein MreC
LKKFWTTRVRAILIAAVVLAILTALAVTLSTSGTTPLRNAANTVLTPVRSGVATLTRQAERLYGYLFKYDSLVAENAELRAQLAEIEGSVREYDETVRENERLRELLGLVEENVTYSLVSTYVTANSGSHWANTITIDKGTNAGLDVGMCAITEYGQVIGLLTEVGVNWATVTTIRDASSEISASVASTGDTGVVQGVWQSGGTYSLRLSYLSTSAVPKNGEQVLTTGSALYPKGLVLGTIVGAGFDETGVSKYADLDPAADFDSLEQVFVITSFQE